MSRTATAMKICDAPALAGQREPGVGADGVQHEGELADQGQQQCCAAVCRNARAATATATALTTITARAKKATSPR
jgi:hypothetical protein